MGTHYNGTKKEVNSLNTYIKLLRSADSLRSRVNVIIQKKGLTESQFSLLDSLYHLGPLSQTVLSKKLLKSGGNITMVVDNLEKRELVVRERDIEDRRQYTIRLTRQGNSLIKKLFPLVLKTIVEEMAALTETEQNELQRVCKILGLNNPSIKNNI